MEPLIFLSLPSSFSSAGFYAKFRDIFSPLSRCYWLSRYSFIRAHSCFWKAPLYSKTSHFLLTSQVQSLIAGRLLTTLLLLFFLLCVFSLLCPHCLLLWLLAWPWRRLPGRRVRPPCGPWTEASCPHGWHPQLWRAQGMG